MTFIEKINIISKKGIDFMGYNETDKIVDKIIRNPKLQQDMLQAPDSFWEDAKNGLLVYSDTFGEIAYANLPEERIVTKYQDIGNKKNIPALVYEKQMKKMKIR